PRRRRRWAGALVTGASACLLLGFVALAVRVHLAGSRLDSIDDPARALALIVERTMDLEDALTGATAWERRVYELTVSDGRNELHEAIAWYEELADTVPGEPGVQVRLAILYGEAGRTDEVLETVDRWRARGDVAWAEVLAAAYLDAPLEGGAARLRAAATGMVEPGGFRDRVRLPLPDGGAVAPGRPTVVAAALAG